MTDAAAPLEPGDQLVAPSSTPRKRRSALAAAGVVGVAAVIGGGVWVGQAFLARGPQPAEALPASTLGYAAVDLDPSGSQKLEAADFLGAFPSLSKGKSSGDLRERFFNLALSDLTCDLDFKDVEPWVGNRAAIAVVGYDKPEFVTVLEVTDGPGLEKGLDKAEECADGKVGHAVRGNWAVLASNDAIAEAVLADGAEAPLSQDADFQKWTDKAGDPGVVTLYAAPAAGDAILKAAEKQPFIAMMAASGFGSLDPIGMGSGLVPLFGVGMAIGSEMEAVEESGSVEGDFSWEPLTKAEEKRLEQMTPKEQGAYFEKKYGPSPSEVMSEEEMDALPSEVGEQMLMDDQASLAAEAAEDLADDEMPPLPHEEMSEEDMAAMEDDFPMPEVPEDVRAALSGFRGAGGVLRFADGALEFELVADHMGTGASDMAAGRGGDDLLDEFSSGAPIAYGASLADGWESHLFDAFSLGMWGGSETSMIKEFENGTGLDYPADLEALGGEGFAVVADKDFDPEEIFEGTPGIAARIHGDAAKVEAALAKLKRNAADSLVWRRDGDDVLVGADKAFLDRLAGASGLSDSKTYQSVLPDASDAASVLFIDFDADNWLVKTSSQRDRADAEPFDALGFSRTVKDGEDHTLVRLTTD